MQVSLKKADIRDAEQMHQMQVTAFLPLLNRYQDYDTNPANETLERVIQRFHQPFTDYYFIVYEGKKVGGIRIINGNENCRISPIFVLPGYQGRGFAQETIHLIENLYTPTKGWLLDTILEEKGHCHLYEKLGYNQTGKIKPINDHMTLVYYEKKA